MDFDMDSMKCIGMLREKVRVLTVYEIWEADDPDGNVIEEVPFPKELGGQKGRLIFETEEGETTVDYPDCPGCGVQLMRGEGWECICPICNNTEEFGG